ncbi:MAG: mycothiol system anti-sigma-R factor [Actinomycetia bacterium]|nr:mycothiol system anti-sigma-R factor [Actinomycetes bacterium]
MSCGAESDVNCSEVLDQVYEYLDGEMNQADIDRVKQHLDDCSPCLDEVGLADAVRQLVAKSCACKPAPEQLKQDILARLTQVRAN